MKSYLLISLLVFLGGCSGFSKSLEVSSPPKEIMEKFEESWKDDFEWQGELLKVADISDNYASMSGAVKVKSSRDGFVYLAVLDNAPDPRGTDYFQVWVKEDDTENWESLTRLEQINSRWGGAAMVNMKPKKDNQIMVTLEQNDANDEPGLVLLNTELLPTGL